MCNLYRLLVASLKAGLDIVPHSGSTAVCRDSSRGNVSGYFHNLGSLITRHRDGRHAHCLSIKQCSVSDSDAIDTSIAFYTASRALASQLDWREPIRLQERLGGKVFAIAVALRCLVPALRELRL